MNGTANTRRMAAIVPARVAAALLGGYAFVWGFVTFGITLGTRLGLDYDDAWMLLMMLAFVLFLAVFLWAFCAKSLLRVWCVLAGGAIAMTVGAALLGARLVPGA